MSRNEVWEQIKNDKNLMYGKPMLDVFLQLTKNLSERHFLELNKEQIEKLSLDAIVDVIWGAKDIEKVAEMLGSQAFNKLDSGQVNYIIRNDDDYHSADETQTFTKTDAILKYRTLNEVDIGNILLFRTDVEDLKKLLNRIEKDKLKLLGADKVAYLLINYLTKFGPFGADEGFKMFKTFAQALGDHINIFKQSHVWNFLDRELPSVAGENLEEILDLLGNENLKKITDEGIEIFQQQGLRYKQSGQKQDADIGMYFDKLVKSLKKRRA
jgi:hypothetical protein